MLSDLETDVLNLYAKADENERYAQADFETQLNNIDCDGKISEALINKGFLNANIRNYPGGGKDVKWDLSINGKKLSNMAIKFLKNI